MSAEIYIAVIPQLLGARRSKLGHLGEETRVRNALHCLVRSQMSSGCVARARQSDPHLSIPSMSTYRPTDRTITHEYHQPITSLAFDPVSDILWTGSSSGAVAAYCTPQAIRGVSFPVGGGQPVHKLVAGDTYVRALGLAGQGVGSWTKGGVNKWYFRFVQPITRLSTGFTHKLAALPRR